MILGNVKKKIRARLQPISISNNTVAVFIAVTQRCSNLKFKFRTTFEQLVDTVTVLYLFKFDNCSIVYLRLAIRSKTHFIDP